MESIPGGTATAWGKTPEGPSDDFREEQSD
jgi:hypothetical protein